MSKYWAQKVNVSDLRAELRAMAAEGNSDAREALAVLRGKRGRLNYIETGAWNAWPHVAAAIQHAGRRVLASD